MAKVQIMANSACMHLFNKITDPKLISMKQNLIIEKFSDGEISVKPQNSVRGAYVYLFTEWGSNLMELLLTLDSLTRASVYKVTLIVPYYSYGRQDKRGTTRGSLGARAIAKVISTFPIVERVVSVDLHADQIQMAWDIPVDNISGHRIFMSAVKNWLNPNTIFCSPDAGGKERVRAYEQELGYPMVYMDKYRAKANEVTSMRLIGDVTGKDVIMIDDMIDTCGTLKKAVTLLKESGAYTVSFVASHAVLSGAALQNLAATPLDRLMLSDTIDYSNHEQGLSNTKIPFIEKVSSIKVLQEVIKKIMNDTSIL